ncbi:GntR family transcriptional regulator [Lacicoccus alkaliphilus]|uniref:DNA-binding transcriptional regulator, GntR family n=1 Tax=Lacicoccus alkaliphilus DSM 16010 TaxID=1123231 RepID=A0A1M7FYD1_9BACL|nr:GntR family transcriptional regulator [Salinicoccus alkaliphilus]SHM09084.1 DNA-binding transcriptional regulator, GntR family [Salinicoccus alkaliphilus DSM 16010]
MKKIHRTVRLSDQAYDIIKASILTGELSAGDALPEERYARQLGISRTPFRDTLARLAAEGLVVQQSGAPAVVAEFTKDKSLEFLELRYVLEVYNLEKVLPKVDDAVISLLRDNLAQQAAAIKADNYSDFMTYDRAFHAIFIDLNPNEELKKVVERYNNDLSRAFLLLSSTVPASAGDALSEHRDILTAIEDKSHITARNKMILHLSNVEQRFMKFYENQK